MDLRLEKKGIRALGVAESFRMNRGDKSVLAGVVMRSDLIIDGFVFGSATLGGDDATDAIIKMFEDLKRNDINIVMLGGAVISLYNIIDVDSIASMTRTPVVSITFKESQGLEPHIKHHFPLGWEKKLEAYRKLGTREKVSLKTGYDVFIRTSGISIEDAKRALDKFTVQGSVPEPVRLARQLAKAKLEWDLRHSF